MANKAGKKNKNTNDSSRGEQGFNSFYEALYGTRWEALKQSFAKPSDSVEFKLDGAQKPYYLDSASIYAAQCLPVDSATDILDLCAAPGGKTLVLASRMGPDAVLFSNERSAQRKHRLAVVVQECLPPQLSERVRVSCSDGATWCKRQTECFDSILLDAPCSSERHVFADPKYLEQWSLSRIKTVTTEQWALLSSAFRLLRRGGWLLYSTCALCPQENDQMIARLEKKFGNEAFEIEREMLPATMLKLEKTQYGYHILPDTSNGAGPIYFSLIKKH